MHRTSIKVDDNLGRQMSFKHFQKIEILRNMFPGHNFIKLEIKNNKISGKEQLEIEQQTYKYHIVERINS